MWLEGFYEITSPKYATLLSTIVFQLLNVSGFNRSMHKAPLAFQDLEVAVFVIFAHPPIFFLLVGIEVVFEKITAGWKAEDFG